MDKQYLISILIVALGLLCGYVLGKIMKKEVKQGKNYLMILQKGLFTACVFIVMYEYRDIVHFIWLGALMLLLYYFYYKRVNQILIYVFYGVLAFLAYDYFLPLAGTQFLYGITTGSLNWKDLGLLIKSGIAYLTVAVLLILLV
ncbi:hypothetical protein JW851_02055 [Candidatus Woesearchaeota archaeon]|nr:hypothetical protein [Candidatus Woesearchaeota archaeon]